MAASRNWLLDPAAAASSSASPPSPGSGCAARRRRSCRARWSASRRRASPRAGALYDNPVPTDADLRAPGVKLVNFFASWCGPCRAEHPILMDLAAEGVPVIGVNYKDRPEAARGWMKKDGNPFGMIATDDDGRIGLDWGIYGVPETFVVDVERHHPDALPRSPDPSRAQRPPPPGDGRRRVIAPGANLHFPPEEFAAREAATLAAMAAAGLDALLIFRQESMYWLTGYDTFGYVHFQALVLTADGRLALLTRSADRLQARFTSRIEEVRIWRDAGDAAPERDLQALLAELGLAGRRIGVEWDAYGLTAAKGRRLADGARRLRGARRRLACSSPSSAP